MGPAPSNGILSPKASISSFFLILSPLLSACALISRRLLPFPSSPPFSPHPAAAASVGPSGILGLMRSLAAGLGSAAWRLQEHLWSLSGDSAPQSKGKRDACGGFLPCSWVLCSGRAGLTLGLFQDRLLSKISVQTQGLCWNNSCTSSSLFG